MLVAGGAGFVGGFAVGGGGGPQTVTRATTVARTVRPSRLLPLRAEPIVYSTPSQPTDFAPAGARITLWRVASRPGLLFVYWDRPDDPRNRKDSPIGAAGFVLWRQESLPGGDRRWRAVYQRRSAPYGYVAVEAADVTGDRIPEVLHSTEQGSGGCGPHYVVRVARARASEIFRRASCETHYRLVRGVLVVDEPVGPCPILPGGAHCFGGRRFTRFAWTGTRLAPKSSAVRCSWPRLRLDPRNECRRRET